MSSYDQEITDARINTASVSSMLEEQERLKANCLPLIGQATDLSTRGNWQSLVDLFEEHAIRQPNHPAIARRGKTLSYGDLHKLTNQIALRIVGETKHKSSAIGLYLSDSWDLIVGAIAIWKAGCYYIHLDPAEPKDRLRYMLKDAKVAICLTNNEQTHQLAEIEDSLTKIQVAREPQPEKIHFERRPLFFEDLSDITYTSGSTGKPKGVLHSHGHLLGDAVHSNSFFHFGPGDRFLHLVLGMETYSSLATGATMVPFTLKGKDSLDLIKVLKDERISSIRIKPSMFRQLLEVVESSTRFESLRLLHLTGEPVYKADIKVCRKVLPEGAFIVGNYGSQEMMNATYFLIDGNTDIVGQAVPAGFPISGRRLEIVDDKGQPVHSGQTGEICLYTREISPGYNNLEEQTSAKFQNNDGITRYLTGDLGYLTKEGCLFVSGRKDNRLKIRGYSVEPSEIELELHRTGHFKQVVVHGHKDSLGNTQLVAYLISANSHKPSTSSLRQHLSDRLPDYMVPGFFEYLESMPLLPSGKIDRRGLPLPSTVRPNLENDHFAPKTKEQIDMLELWEDILGISGIGIRDSFFELGGDSIKMMSLTNRIWKKERIRIEAAVVFKNPTIEAICRIKSGLQPSLTTVADKYDRSKSPPLSFGQERLWFLQQLEPNSTVYNVVDVINMTGQLDVAALEKSLHRIISRHDIMRSRIELKEGRPEQVIDEVADTVLEIQEHGHCEASERENHIDRVTQELSCLPINLAKDHPWIFRLLKFGNENCTLFVLRHHIASDGWSEHIFLQELSQNYNALIKGDALPDEDLELSYADYAQWLRNKNQQGHYDKQLTYWMNELKDVQSLSLPTDHPRPAKPSYDSDSYSLHFPKSMTREMKRLGKETGSTLYMILLAAFDILLYRHTGQRDISLGTPVSTRGQSEFEKLIGFFLNMVVIRNCVNGEQEFSEFLKSVREKVMNATAHQDLPFETLVEALNPTRGVSSRPLFQIIFTLQNSPPRSISMDGLSVDAGIINADSSDYDMVVYLREDGDDFLCNFSYNTDLWNLKTIETMAKRFQCLLQSICKNPGQLIAQLEWLSEHEQQQISQWAEGPRNDYPKDKCIHALFEEQVSRTPDAIAVVFGEEQLTYGELDSRANQLASHLQSLCVEPEVLVGLYIERSIEMIVAILATLKAGGTYLPLDLDYPKARLAYMLKDADPKVLLTQRQQAEKLLSFNGKVLCVDEFERNSVDRKAEKICCTAKADNLAYVIYTSGSTGVPKGNCIEHRSVVRLVKETNYVKLSEDEVFLQLAPISFDAATFELWGSLLNGAKLVIAPPGVQTAATLGELIVKNSISVLWLTSTLFNVMVDEALPSLTSVRQLLAGGEALSAKHVKRMLASLKPQHHLINGYGPTENTTFTTCFVMDASTQIKHSVPIGVPISNTQVYILDKNLAPVPIGVTGELHIGGDGLARGYLNRPELTAEKFIQNPFDSGRLYKTGDQVRYLADGTIEFLGRMDNQVKLRGFRIELGEIESQLNEHPAIKVSAVIVKEQNDQKQLVAYYTVKDGESQPVESSEVRAYLKERLPDYMIPGAFIRLDEIPLTANGKIDRRKLEERDVVFESAQKYVAPDTEIERKLAAIWTEVLKIEKIGIHDNFFDLGGHSLLAVKLMSRIEQELGKKLQLSLLFQAPTIAELAHHIDSDFQNTETSSLCLVSIQPKGTRTPFFCVHGWGGNVLGFQKLSNYLGDDQPFYGLQSKGLRNPDLADHTIEAMAASYIKEIREQFPEGPYLIGGHSFGGWVAYEMGCQLLDAGCQVGLIALLDAGVRFHKREAKLINYSRRLRYHLKQLLLAPEVSRTLYVKRKFRTLKRRLNSSIWQRRAKFYYEQGEKLPEDLSNVREINYRAMRRYQQRSYPLKVTLFRASECKGIHDPRRTWTYGWDKFALAGVEVCEVPGNHVTIILEPHVGVLAEQLRAQIDKNLASIDRA